MNLSYLSEPAENSYIIDVESGVESARLMQLEIAGGDLYLPLLWPHRLGTRSSDTFAGCAASHRR